MSSIINMIKKAIDTVWSSDDGNIITFSSEMNEEHTKPVTGLVVIDRESKDSNKYKLISQMVYDLLVKIDDGYIASDDEKRLLCSITNIVWENICELPKSLGMLESLRGLNICDTTVRDLKALSSSRSLIELYISRTDVNDISVLSELKNLKRLGLSSTKISDINALSNLTMLTHLNLSRTDISDISALSNLKMLAELNLSRTDISDINTLSELKNLKRLDLSSTKISDINALSNLTMLTHLNLSRTGINNIGALSELRNLKRLDLSSTKVTDIRELSNLKLLTILFLHRTEIKDTSPLSSLKHLRKIDLSESVIGNLNGLSELTSLTTINLQNSKTDVIPENFLNLNVDFITVANESDNWQFYSGVFIYGLTLTNQPIEIFSQSKELIRAYYKAENKVPVNECKVIFLGDAESGKTHSIQRLLRDGEYIRNFDGESTAGIEISADSIKLRNKEIIVNYWDFGGQEIQHSMHRMFLTERTLYVVFLNARQDKQIDDRASYWMENLRAFAPKTPVLVVINKIDQNNQPRFNERGFLDSYGNQVKRVIRLSAKEDVPSVFIDKLEGSIKSIISKYLNVGEKVPLSWKSLMKNIRTMPNNYLTTEQFTEKCKFYNVKNFKDIHDDLVDLFQVIGISFCYKDRSISNYMLLNPKWMLNALYTIVINGKTVSQNGTITQNDLYDLLEKEMVNGTKIKRVYPSLKYKSFEINYILGVIRMFGLSYRLKDGSEFFPMLCDGSEKISVKEAVPENALHFIFRYTYLPTNIMHRLIVEMQRDLDYPNVWYTGAVFRNTLQNQTAYIHSIGNDLHIYVYGENKYYNLNEYLTPISNIVRDINKNMGLSATELLTYRSDSGEAEIPFKRVIGNLKNKIYEQYDETIDEIIHYDALAHRYFDEHPKTDNILKSVVFALQEMQSKKIYYSCNEDSRNSFVSSHLTAQLQGTGYTCADQQTGGTSLTGKAPGERDFVVKNGIGQEILIYEGLNLKTLDKTYIDKHIKKVLDNYNPQGLQYSILTTYLECDSVKFNSFTDKYRDHIAEYAPEPYSCIDKPVNVRFNGEFLRCMKMEYEVGGIKFFIYHIIVKMGQ